MYNRHLDTFIQAADCGSFLKAGERLYISANAVTKQINLLEDHLGLKLFHRSTQGLELTEAGKVIYTEAKKMIRHSRSAIQKARELENRHEYVIHIGVSLMNPATVLLAHWHRAAKLHPDFRLEIVPFEDTVPSFQEVLDNLGKKVDLLSCPYDTYYWGDRYNSFHLQDLPLMVACSKSHPLSEKTRLTLEELHGQTLLFPKRGSTSYADPARDYLEKNHPQIQLEDMEYIDIAQFNHMVSSDQLMMSAQCWDSVHPLISTISVDWDYTMPYGLIYSKEPSRELLQFLMAVGQINEKETEPG